MGELLRSSGSTPAANHGTCAHELSERCLASGADPAEFAGQVVDLRVQGPGRISDDNVANGNTAFPVDDEMVEGVGKYIDAIATIADGTDWDLEYEVRVNLHHIHPELYGTGDVVGYNAATKHLLVGDLKFGMGVVEPTSLQLMTYAVGAVHRLQNRGVDRVTCMIVQPRAWHKDGPVRTVEYDAADMVIGEERIRQAIVLAELPDAPLAAGDHCRFCPAMAECPTHAEALGAGIVAIEMAADVALPTLPVVTTLSDEQVGRLVENASRIEAWIVAVKRMAREAALGGRSVPGMKLVAGRRLRKWKSDDLARATFDVFEIDPTDFTVVKLVSPAALEKRLGKVKASAVMAGLLADDMPSLSLVPVLDPRPAVSAPGSSLQAVTEE